MQERACGRLEIFNQVHLPCLLGTRSLLALQESLHPPDGERGGQMHAARWMRFGRKEKEMEKTLGAGGVIMSYLVHHTQLFQHTKQISTLCIINTDANECSLLNKPSCSCGDNVSFTHT